jgi:carbon monoxide dehydrogenase subunit G
MGTPLEVAARITVPAGPEQVWQAVIDWPRQREWIPATRVTGGQGVGAEVTGWTGLGPAGFTDRMVITEWEPPRRCVVSHTGRVVRGTGVFEVIPQGAASEFRWAEHLQLPLPPAAGKAVTPLLRPIARWGLALALRRFARLFAPS